MTSGPIPAGSPSVIRMRGMADTIAALQRAAKRGNRGIRGDDFFMGLSLPEQGMRRYLQWDGAFLDPNPFIQRALFRTHAVRSLVDARWQLGRADG